MQRFEGKTVLVTGGNSGIGLAAARAFASEGARVVITGRDAQTLEAARQTLGEGALAAAPVVVVKGTEAELGAARYAPTGELPAGTRPILVKADKKGRLLVDGDASFEDFSRRDAVIYVHKLLR